MNKNTNLIIGLLIVIALVGYYGYLIVSANQSTALGVATDPMATAQANDTALDEKTLLEIRTRTLNGNLPITLQESDLGATQLFGS